MPITILAVFFKFYLLLGNSHYIFQLFLLGSDSTGTLGWIPSFANSPMSL